MHLSNDPSLAHFIHKIHSIILRARHVSNSSLSEPFVVRASPSHLDIFGLSSQTLLERWVLSYEPHSSHYLNSQSSQVLHSDVSSTNLFDTSELVLLLQSLYSYIRLMPLGNCLSNSTKNAHLLGHW